MSTKSDLLHEMCIKHCEEFYMDRVTELVDQSKYDDAGCLHDEFVVDGEEADSSMFIEDITNV